MFEIILKTITYVFVEMIVQGLILKILKGIKTIGLIILKLATLSEQSIKELCIIYKDSSKPHFLGFGAAIGITYLIFKFIIV